MADKEKTSSSRRMRVIDQDDGFNFSAYEADWQKFWTERSGSSATGHSRRASPAAA